MKITESQLKTIILEEAAKVKKAITLKKQLSEIQKQLDEVMGGPHGGGKKTFKKAEGGFSENPGALVEKELEENGMGVPAGAADCSPMNPGFGQQGGQQQQGETYEFTEQELEEMLKMSDESVIPGGTTEDGVSHEMRTGEDMHSQEEPVVAENVDDPFTQAAPSKDQLSESVEVLRMRKLAGLL